MAERRENSVLFSLKELRRIEDDRVKKEQDEVRARIEADRLAKEAAVRAAREDEERRKRDEEDRLRRIEEEKENKVRDDQFRLQESERRARVEGELKLQEERMRLEVHARSGHKSPVKAIAGVALVLVAVAGMLGYKMYANHQTQIQAIQARNDELERQGKLAQAEFEQKMTAIKKELSDRLAAAKSEEERVKIRAEAARSEADAVARVRHRTSGGRTGDRADSSSPSPSYKRPGGKKEVSDNPLEGL